MNAAEKVHSAGRVRATNRPGSTWTLETAGPGHSVCKQNKRSASSRRGRDVLRGRSKTAEGREVKRLWVFEKVQCRTSARWWEKNPRTSSERGVQRGKDKKKREKETSSCLTVFTPLLSALIVKVYFPKQWEENTEARKPGKEVQLQCFLGQLITFSTKIKPNPNCRVWSN